jgi:cytochrome b subunit of formate dehydrogenase
MATVHQPIAQESHVEYWRFNLWDRVTHLLLIISMVGLIGSRFPLKFSDAIGARGAIALMGGVGGAGVIHRVSAIILGIACAMNLLSVAYLVLVKRRPLLGPDSIVPRWKDFTDLWQHALYFFGRGERPKFDRYTYWEKFDYLAVFWGMAIIGGGGLVLWFPTIAARFLPGIVINLAYLAHSEEAMLAFGFLIVVHLFNTHLRPERFPLDKVIFTGKISADEWACDHSLEWERLQSRPERLEEQKVH